MQYYMHLHVIFAFFELTFFCNYPLFINFLYFSHSPTVCSLIFYTFPILPPADLLRLSTTLANQTILVTDSCFLASYKSAKRTLFCQV